MTEDPVIGVGRYHNSGTGAFTLTAIASDTDIWKFADINDFAYMQSPTIASGDDLHFTGTIHNGTGSEIGLFSSTWSPILDHKPTSDTLDDEFDSPTLDGSWTAVTGSIGTVDPFETGEVEKFDPTTRPGWLLLQAGSAADQKVELRKDITLADGDSVIMAVGNPQASSDGDSGFVDNEHWIGMCLNDNDTAYDAGEWDALFCQTQIEGPRIIFFDGTTTNGSTSPPNTQTGLAGKLVYLRLARIGSVIRAAMTTDGSAWTNLGSITRSATATNVWVFTESVVAAGEPVPISAVRWIRQGTNALDPWSHSPLVSVAQVEDWTDFTPKLTAITTDPTVGNGSIFGKYRRTGNSVEVAIRFIFGSTSTAGSGIWHFEDLPYIPTFVEVVHVGALTISDAGTGWWSGICQTESNATTDQISMVVSDGSAAASQLTHADPIVWADGDDLRLTLTYDTSFL